MPSRRTSAARSSRPGIFRTPSQVQFRRRRRVVLGTNLRDYAGADSFTFSVTDSAVLLKFISKPSSDTFSFSISESGLVGSPVDKGPGTDNFTFSITQSSVLSKPINHGPVSDSFNFSITDNAVRLTTKHNWSLSDAFTFSVNETEILRRDKFGVDSFTFSITDDGVRRTLGPTTGTRISPALAIPEGPIAGSKIYWEAETPYLSTVTVETSVDGGASWQAARSGDAIARLPLGSDLARAVLTRATLTRNDSNDPSPRLLSLTVEVDVDSSVDEFVPLGVFHLNEVNITEGNSSTDANTSGSNQATSSTPGQAGAQGTGIEITLSGNDFSRRISRNPWEAVYTIPAGTNFGDAIKQVISNRLPETEFNFASTAEVTNQLTFGAQGTNDPWSDVLDCAQAIGMEIYFDARGICTMRPEPDPDIDTPVYVFNDTANPVMIDIARRITDEDTFNVVIVTGESSDNAAPARGIAYDSDPSSPTYYLGPYGQQVYRITTPLVTSNDQAKTMAEAVLLRRKGATEIVEIDVVPNPAVEHGDVVTLERDLSKLDGPCLVDQTTVPLGADKAMHLVSRRHKLAASRSPGGGVGGLPGGSGGGGGGGGTFTPDSFTFAFSSCANRAIDGNDDSTAYTAIKNAHPDYFCHLGDVWYDDGGSNHVSHWNAAFGSTNYAALIASLPNPQIVNWSDHDFGFANNGTGVGNPVTAAANSAYRTKFTGLDLPTNGIYRTWTRGRIRFILLDCLTFKSPLGTSSSSSRTMLGTTQKAWLKDLLSHTEYPMIVMLGDGQWPGPAEDLQDEWRGYDHERQELASAFSASPATLIYLNGDTHSLAYGHDQFGLDRIWQASPLKNNTKVKAAGAGYIATYPTNANEGPVAHQYGIISFVDNGTTITATFRGYGDGSVRLTDSITVNKAA